MMNMKSIRFMQLFSNPLNCRGVRSVAARYLNYPLWLFKNRAATERTPLQFSGFCSFFAYAFIVIFSNICFMAQANANETKKVLDIQHWKTKTGTPVYFVQTQHTPVLVLQIAFDGGSARDGDLPGTSALVNALMNEGNAGLTATQLAEGFENIGAQYDHWVDRDMTGFQLKTMTYGNADKVIVTDQDKNKAKFNAALDNFTKVFQPDFPLAAFEREKKQQKIAISRANESPDIVAQKALLKAIYLNHPYGNTILGTEKSVEKIQLDNIKSFYNQYYTAPNAIISMSGDIDRKTAEQIAEQITQTLPEGKKAEPLPEATEENQAIQENIKYPSSQTIIRLGQVGISHQDPDYFALMLGNYSLGGGTLVSRLSDEIREKRGLTYGITSSFSPMVAKGPFVIGLATRTEKSKEALEVTQKTLKQFLIEGSSATELTAAKRFIKGNFPLRFETNSGIASALLTIGFNHLPVDYLDTYLAHIDAVTTAQIKAAFDKHIHPESMVTVMVGKTS